MIGFSINDCVFCAFVFIIWIILIIFAFTKGARKSLYLDLSSLVEACSVAEAGNVTLCSGFECCMVVVWAWAGLESGEDGLKGKRNTLLY